MNKATLFADFLREHVNWLIWLIIVQAILNEDEKKVYVSIVAKYEDTSKNKKDVEQPKEEIDLETRLIFSLADLLKSHDSSKFYGTSNYDHYL